MNIINSSQNSPTKTKANPRRREAEIHVTRAIEKIEQQKQAHSERRHIKVLELTKVWKNDVLPHWQSLSDSKYVRELCAKGIPPSIRGQIWSLLIGNQLKISDETFDNLKTIAELSSQDFSNSEYNENVINIENEERKRSNTLSSFEEQNSRIDNNSLDNNNFNNIIDNNNINNNNINNNNINNNNINNNNINNNNNSEIIQAVDKEIELNLDKIGNNNNDDEDDDDNYHDDDDDDDDDEYFDDDIDNIPINELNNDNNININNENSFDSEDYKTPSSSYKDCSPAKIITSYDKTSPIRIKTDLNKDNKDNNDINDNYIYESEDDNTDNSPSQYRRKVLAGSTPGKPLFPGRTSKSNYLSIFIFVYEIKSIFVYFIVYIFL
jgi:hypothetical protein